MADIVNLRLARKRKARELKDRTAEQNRLSHGRSGAEKKRDAAEAKLFERQVDAHKRDRPSK